MISKLMKIGLTEGESKVYQALMNNRDAKVGLIVKASGTSYSKVYDVLNRLMKKGLVSYILKNNVKHFNVVEPHKLSEYIEKKEQELAEQKSIIDEITKNMQKNNQSKNLDKAEIFFGLNGLQTAYKIILNNSKPGDVFRYFFPFKFYDEIPCSFYEKLYPFQQSKQLKERGIAHIDFKHSEYYKRIKKCLKFKFVSFPVPSTIEILNEHLLIVSWETQTGFLISSKDVVKQFSKYFDEIWKIAQ